MAKKQKIQGYIREQKSRYYWTVFDPIQKKRRTITLKLPGSKYATTNFNTAKRLAQRQWDIWQKSLKQSTLLISQISSVQICCVSDLVKAYLPRAFEKYNDKSKIPDQMDNVLNNLISYAGDLEPESFSPLKLREFRESYLKGKHTHNTVNKYMGHVTRMFKWAASYEIIDQQIPYALETVEKIAESDPRVNPSKEREPVPLEDVNEVLHFARPMLSKMIRLQLYTALRPSELLHMQLCEIDTSSDDGYWYYCPTKHKNSWRGKKHKRVVPLGSHAQQILMTLMTRKQDDYIFKPSEAVAEHEDIRHSKRETPEKYGNSRGTNCKGTRQLNDCYDASGYRKAIRRVISRINRQRKMDAVKQGREFKEEEKMIPWTPYQLRHTAATLIRTADTDEALTYAQAMLGHKNIDTTEIYARIGLKKAIQAVSILDQIQL